MWSRWLRPCRGCWCQMGWFEYLRICWSPGIFTSQQLFWVYTEQWGGKKQLKRWERSKDNGQSASSRAAAVTQITTLLQPWWEKEKEKHLITHGMEDMKRMGCNRFHFCWPIAGIWGYSLAIILDRNLSLGQFIKHFSGRKDNQLFHAIHSTDRQIEMAPSWLLDIYVTICFSLVHEAVFFCLLPLCALWPFFVSCYCSMYFYFFHPAVLCCLSSTFLSPSLPFFPPPRSCRCFILLWCAARFKDLSSHVHACAHAE